MSFFISRQIQSRAAVALRAVLVCSLFVVGCGAATNQGNGDGGSHACSTVADCPVNTGASCAQVCQDGSNPCLTACVLHQCVSRGCPNDDAGAHGDMAAPIDLSTSDDLRPPADLRTSGDGPSCQENGAPCTKGADCCSNNCILRGNPGFCCMPGGCP